MSIPTDSSSPTEKEGEHGDEPGVKGLAFELSWEVVLEGHVEGEDGTKAGEEGLSP